MRKLILVLIMLVPLILLSACTIADSNIQEKITSPNNNTSPIQGKWIIEEKIKVSEEAEVVDDSLVEEQVDTYIGREVLFNKEAMVVGDDHADHPTFKLKNVNTNDYLLYKYKIKPSTLNIDSETIQVITALKKNQVFYEFVRYNQDSLFIIIDNSFYKMSKVVDEVSLEEVNRYINIERNMMSTLDTIEVKDLDSGILLGIKIPTYDEVNEIPDWQYKTIWIRSENRNITKYELDKLLVPRKNGFWIVGVDREDKTSSISDKVVAMPQFPRSDLEDVAKELEISISRLRNEPATLAVEKPTILKDILFIGNDYISIEKTEVDNKNKKTLEIYALDNIEEEKPIKLSDIIGDGDLLFNEGSQNIQSLGENVVLSESNVGLVRKNGYWILKGRVNYRQNEEELHKDFNIKAIPPQSMVSYDELGIPWDIVSTQFPGAVDVFSSPNEEIIIVVTNSQIQIYPIDNGDITSLDPIATVEIPNNASIIMSEWALGRYPDIWENEMMNQGGQIIE